MGFVCTVIYYCKLAPKGLMDEDSRRALAVERWCLRIKDHMLLRVYENAPLGRIRYIASLLID